MRQIYHSTFLDDVKQLASTYLTPDLYHYIVFELTESALAEDIDKLIHSMNELKNFGFSFSIDDFGTGYSSLSYLRKVPLDEIKIDRSFIEELTSNKYDQSMIEIIFNLSRVFGLKVVAEGIETPEQESILLKNDCDLMQGYLFAKPLEKSAFEKYINTPG